MTQKIAVSKIGGITLRGNQNPVLRQNLSIEFCVSERKTANCRHNLLVFDSIHRDTKNSSLQNWRLLFFGDPSGNRTHDYAVRGRRLSRLTMGPLYTTYVLYHTILKNASAFFKKIKIFIKNFQRANL